MVLVFVVGAIGFARLRTDDAAATVDADDEASEPVPPRPVFADLMLNPTSLPDEVESEPVYALVEASTSEHQGAEYAVFGSRDGDDVSDLVLIERTSRGDASWDIPETDRREMVAGRHGRLLATARVSDRGAQLFFDGGASSFRVTAARGGVKRAALFAAAIDFRAEQLVVDEVAGSVVLAHGVAPAPGGGAREVVYVDVRHPLSISVDSGRLPGIAGIVQHRPTPVSEGFVHGRRIWTTRVGSEAVVVLEWEDGQSVWVRGWRPIDELVSVAMGLEEVAAAEWSAADVVVDAAPEWGALMREREQAQWEAERLDHDGDDWAPPSYVDPGASYAIPTLPEGWSLESTDVSAFGFIDLYDHAVGLDLEERDGRIMVVGSAAVLLGIFGDDPIDSLAGPDALELDSPVVHSAQAEEGVIAVAFEHGPIAETPAGGGLAMLAPGSTAEAERLLALVPEAATAADLLPPMDLVIDGTPEVASTASLVLERDGGAGLDEDFIVYSMSKLAVIGLATQPDAVIELLEEHGETRFWRIEFDRDVALLRTEPDRAISTQSRLFTPESEAVALEILRSFVWVSPQEFAEYSGFELLE